MFILFAFINYSTKLHVIIIHLAYCFGTDEKCSVLIYVHFMFILFAFINYSTKLHVIIIHLAGSPGSYFAYLKDCLKKRSKKLECKLSLIHI